MVTVEILDVDPDADDTTAETDKGSEIDDISITFLLANGALADHVVDISSDAQDGSCTVDQSSISATGADGTATVTYTPDAGFSGEDECTFTVTDGDLDTADGVIVITVNDTAVILFPGGSAIDLLSLVLLLGLPEIMF